MAAYAALQGIDGVHWFGTSTLGWDNSWTKWPVNTPTIMGQFPAFALMYRRGDVQEAPVVLHETQTLDGLYELGGSRVYERMSVEEFEPSAP